jgi:hypothetical protein
VRRFRRIRTSGESAAAADQEAWGERTSGFCERSFVYDTSRQLRTFKGIVEARHHVETAFGVDQRASSVHTFAGDSSVFYCPCPALAVQDLTRQTTSFAACMLSVCLSSCELHLFGFVTIDQPVVFQV